MRGSTQKWFCLCGIVALDYWLPVLMATRFVIRCIRAFTNFCLVTWFVIFALSLIGEKEKKGGCEDEGWSAVISFGQLVTPRFCRVVIVVLSTSLLLQVIFARPTSKCRLYFLLSRNICTFGQSKSISLYLVECVRYFSVNSAAICCCVRGCLVLCHGYIWWKNNV